MILRMGEEAVTHLHRILLIKVKEVALKPRALVILVYDGYFVGELTRVHPYKKALVDWSALMLYYRLNPAHSVLVVELIGTLKFKGFLWGQEGPDLHKDAE